MNEKTKKIALICIIVGGLALTGVIIGMIARLSDTVIKICGAITLVCMIALACFFVKAMKGKN